MTTLLKNTIKWLIFFINAFSSIMIFNIKIKYLLFTLTLFFFCLYFNTKIFLYNLNTIFWNLSSSSRYFIYVIIFSFGFLLVLFFYIFFLPAILEFMIFNFLGDFLNYIIVLTKKLPEGSLSLYDILYGYWPYCRNFLSHENTLERFDNTKIIYSQNMFHLFYYSESDFDDFFSKWCSNKNLTQITCNSITDFLKLGYDLKKAAKIYMCTSLENNYVFEDNLNRVRIHKILIETRDNKLITINLNDYDGDLCHKSFIYFDGDDEWDYLNLALRYEKPGYQVYCYKETLSSMLELNFSYFSPEDFPTKYAHLFVRHSKDLNNLLINFNESFAYNIMTFNNWNEFKDKMMFSGNPKFDKNVLAYNMEENKFSALFVDEVRKNIYHVKSLSMDPTEDDSLVFVRDIHDFPFNNNFIVKPLDANYNVFKDYFFNYDYQLNIEDLKESHKIFFFDTKDWEDFLKRLEYKLSPDLFKNKNVLYFSNDKMLEDFFENMQIDFDDIDFGHICYIFVNEDEYYCAYVFYQKSHHCFFIVYTDTQILTPSELNWARRKMLNNLIFTNTFEKISIIPLSEPNDISFKMSVKSVVNKIPGRFNQAYFFRAKSWETFRELIVNEYLNSKQILFFPDGYNSLDNYLNEHNLKYTDMSILKAIDAKIYDPINNKLFGYDIIITKKNVWFVRTDFSEEDREFYNWIARSYSDKNQIFGHNNDKLAEDFFNQYFVIVNDSKSCNYFGNVLAKQDKFETDDFFYSKFNTANFTKKKYFFQYIYLLSHTNFSEYPVKQIKIVSDYKELMFELRKEGCNFNPTHERFSRFSVVNVVNKSNLETHSFNIIETENTVFLIPQSRDIRYFIDLTKMLLHIEKNPEKMNSILKGGGLNGSFYYYNDCEFAKKTFNSFFKNNFHFQQHYSFYEKDLFFKNNKELLEKIQLLWLYKESVYSQDSNFSSNVFSKFIPINITPDFFEPVKIVNCSEEQARNQIQYLAKNYSIENFSSTDSILESDFKLSPEDKENLEKKNYDWFNEMLTLEYNDKSGVFDNSGRVIFVFNEDHTKLAVAEVCNSEFDEDIKSTFCYELYDENSEKKKFYLKNESFIFLKKSKADYFAYGQINDSLTKEASAKQKQEFIKDLKIYIRHKEDDDEF